MEEKAITGQVIIVLTEHLTFGTLLIPYMAEQSDDGAWQLIEQAFHGSLLTRENSIPFSA